MGTIYEKALAEVSDMGAGFRVDFRRRTAVVGGRKVIDGGKWEGELGVPVVSRDNALALITAKYAVYRHSVPSAKSMRHRRTYFSALDEKELDDADMMYGERRERARADLELTVLMLILNGSLTWDEESMGRWFWKSPRQPSLVVLREWLSPVGAAAEKEAVNKNAA